MLFIPVAGASLWMPTPLPNDPTRHHLFALLTGAVGSSRRYVEHEVALVSISSVRPGVRVDKSCILDAGDHANIHHESYVVYRRAQLTTVGVLQRGLDDGTWFSRGTFAEEVRQRILEGAFSSALTPRKVKSFLRQHT